MEKDKVIKWVKIITASIVAIAGAIVAIIKLF